MKHTTEVYSNAAGYFWLCSCGKKFIYPDEIREVNEHCGIPNVPKRSSAQDKCGNYIDKSLSDLK